MPTKITGPKGSTDQHGLGVASGLFAHAEGGTTVASGDYSHAESGAIASGSNAHAEGGGTASGSLSHAQGLASASGSNSHAEGNSSIASGANSHAQGMQSVASRFAQHAQASGILTGGGGDAQHNVFTSMRETTNATPVTLFLDGGTSVTLTGESTNVLTVPVNKGHRFRIEAIAHRVANDEFAAWTVTGTIVRTSSGSARFISTPGVTTDADAAASAWVFAVSVNTTNTTNNYLQLTVTGEAAKTIRWVAVITTTEVS